MYPHTPISTNADPFPQSYLVNLLPDGRFLVNPCIESLISLVQLLGYVKNCTHDTDALTIFDWCQGPMIHLH
jgi:hypothetical protein